MTLKWEVMPEGWSQPTCGAPSPGGRMRCEYPPDHMILGAVVDHHIGRDRLGRWRTWPMRECGYPGEVIPASPELVRLGEELQRSVEGRQERGENPGQQAEGHPVDPGGNPERG